MITQVITPPKQKSWGYIPHNRDDAHFHTGYDGYAHGQMRMGENVVITGDFQITDMSRGQSSATFDGHFRDHEEVSYDLGMQGMVQLFALIQSGKFAVRDGYISGRWTLAKQGRSIFLKPYVGE